MTHSQMFENKTEAIIITVATKLIIALEFLFISQKQISILVVIDTRHGVSTDIKIQVPGLMCPCSWAIFMYKTMKKNVENHSLKEKNETVIDRD